MKEILKKHGAKILAFLAGVAAEAIADIAGYLRALLGQ